MAFSLDCTLPGCDVEMTGETEEEVMRHVAEHGADYHADVALDAPRLAKIRKAIRKR